MIVVLPCRPTLDVICAKETTDMDSRFSEKARETEAGTREKRGL